jgi:hypothetical protein
MKIIISAKGPDLTARVGQWFGTSPYLIMGSYFGWLFVLILTFFTITGSVAAGYLVRVLVNE